MSQNITGNIRLSASVTETLTDGVGTGTLADVLTSNPAFNNGTGSGNINEHFVIDSTLTASTPVTHTLSALTDGLGRSVAFAKVRWILILNLETTDGHDLTIGAAATHPWTGFLGGTTPTVTIKAGGALLIVAPLATALAVTAASSDQLKLDPGSNGVHYQMLIAGE